MSEQRSAGAEETAAIAAAIERFIAETASSPEGSEERIGPWRRAALVEGVSAKRTIEDLEGGMR